MHINFPSVDESFIKQKVAMGYYSNPTELVRDAVRRFREMDGNSALEAALAVGERDIAAGRVKPYTRKLFHKIKREALKKARSSDKLNPDVLP